MKSSTYIFNLLAAVSAGALAVALPASAQSNSLDQKTSSTISSTKEGVGSQIELKNKIQALKDAQTELKSASKSKTRALKKELRQDLQSLKRNLASNRSAVSDKSKKGLTSAIDNALKAFNKQSTQSRDLAMALDPVITELQDLDRSGSHRASTNQRTFGQVNSNARENDTASKQNGANPNQQASADIKIKAKAPEVAVQQPAPEVQVQQPAPKVTIQQARPEVIINQPKPDVKVIQAKPKVTVESAGEPKVTIEQEGDPKVRVEQAEADKNKGGDRSSNSERRQAASGLPQERNPQMAESNRSNPELDRLRKMGRTLVGKTLYGAKNDSVGEIENVVMKNGEVTAVLVDVGGFLGLGEKRIAIPLEKLKMENGRLTTTLTEDEAKDLEAYRD